MRQPDNQHDQGVEETVQAQARVRERPGSGTTQLFEPVWARDFTDLSYEWRRLFSELFGTFLLVLAAAGAAVVQDRSRGQIGNRRSHGPRIDGAGGHLVHGCGVRGAFEPHRQHRVRVAPRLSVAPRARLHCGPSARCGPGWAAVAGQLRDVANLGATQPGTGFSPGQAFLIEVVLTLGLVSTILGTASRAQNVGPLSASVSAPISRWPGCGPARSAVPQ